MAEGWARRFHASWLEPYSAGVRAGSVDPRAVQVMQEVGIDISHQRSKEVRELVHQTFEVVITLCDHARETCPSFPGAPFLLHRGFDDPPLLARSARTEEEALGHYRRVRDEIRNFIQQLPEILRERRGAPPSLKVPRNSEGKRASRFAEYPDSEG